MLENVDEFLLCRPYVGITMQYAVTNPITNKLWWANKIWKISIPVMSQIMIFYLRRCYMTSVTEVRPIQTLIKGKHVIKFVIVLGKYN